MLSRSQRKKLACHLQSGGKQIAPKGPVYIVSRSITPSQPLKDDFSPSSGLGTTQRNIFCRSFNKWIPVRYLLVPSAGTWHCCSRAFIKLCPSRISLARSPLLLLRRCSLFLLRSVGRKREREHAWNQSGTRGACGGIKWNSSGITKWDALQRFRKPKLLLLPPKPGYSVCAVVCFSSTFVVADLQTFPNAGSKFGKFYRLVLVSFRGFCRFIAHCKVRGGTRRRRRGGKS